MGNELDSTAPHLATTLSLGSVLILGGGLAGMAAAWRLCADGYGVTLLERRPYLGGRAYSFVDRDTGAQIDNGQHVFMRCCTAYTDFIHAVGTMGLMYEQSALRVEVRNPDGRSGVLSAAPLPAPLHLVPSFLRYPHISWRDKLRAVPALLRIQRERDHQRPELTEMSFEEWLRANGQSDRAIANFWDLTVVPTLNDASRDVSASMAFMMFKTSLLSGRHSADIGFARASLSEVMGDAVEARLREQGVTLLLGYTAERIGVTDGAVDGVTVTRGETLRADWYVSALPPYALTPLLDAELQASPAFAPAATHDYAPIVNVHVWYDREVTDIEWVAFVDSPLQYVFNRTRIANLDGPGQYLTISLSAAWEYWPKPKAEIQALFLAELARAFPRAKEAVVKNFAIVKEQRATFRVPPNAPANRLTAITPLRNLILAGDWTDTGWPATMESAVRSGNAAAAAVVTKGALS